MASTILLSGFVLFFPAITLYSEQKYRIIQWIGAVVICYVSGMLLGNLPFLEINTAIFHTLSEASVSLAIPALLFSAKLSNAWKHTRQAILSFTLCAIAVSISGTVASWLLAGNITDAWKLSGMLIGVYTGGTPNMSAIGKALAVDEELFILVNSADILLSGVYFIFLITIGQRSLQLFLPKTVLATGPDEQESEAAFGRLPLPTKFKNIIKTLGLTFLILLTAAGISWFFTGGLSAPLVILVLTSLGLAASFIPAISRMEGSYQTAHYLLLIFALSIGVLADFSKLISASPAVFLYAAFVMSAAVALHYLLAAFLRIDTDMVMITSTAAIFGPAFVGPVAGSIHNRQIIVAGITTGMLGYAVGNYLGLAIAYLLR